MYKSERIRKAIYELIVDYLRNNVEDYYIITEAVGEILQVDYNLIFTQMDVEYLVDQMWDDAEQQVREENDEAEAAYMVRYESLCDAAAGRW